MRITRRRATLLTLTSACCGVFGRSAMSTVGPGRKPAAPDPLAAQVTIYRDDFGVPHIVAETEEAAFFGYGYAQAEDHLERMMMQYRDAQGRRAEILGPGALGSETLHFNPEEYRWDGDYLQRLLRTKQMVLDRRAEIDPGVYRILESFAKGINHYIGRHRESIPAWIDGVTAEDVEALERSNYLRFYSIHDALSKLAQQSWALPHFGSNQWAVSRTKSANGRILHLEQTHMPWGGRFQNYEAHLLVPGKLNAGGMSWFGSPFFLMGFNDRITWSATWNQPNISDVYEEKINPENRMEYLYEGTWRPIRAEMAVFNVKGPNGMYSVSRPLYYTHHGPIVRFDQDRKTAWSVKLPNFEGVNYSLGLYSLMKAQDLDQFKAALARQLIPRWNFLYSDSRNIFWVHNGNVPQRDESYDWFKPVPGWEKKAEWGPLIPFSRYPQLANPPSGFLQNCNNPFWLSTTNSGLDPSALGPYYLAYSVKHRTGTEALNTRGERVLQVLSQNRKFTPEQMMDLGYDTYVLPADIIIPLLTEAAAANSVDATLRPALEQMQRWNRRSAIDSLATTYFYYWAKSYIELFSEQKYNRFLANDRGKINIHSSREQDMCWRAFTQGIDRMQHRFGRIDVPWGHINVVVRGGVFPLSGASAEIFGVLHPDQGPEQSDGRIVCRDGWGHFMVVIEADPATGSGKEVWSLLPYGESEQTSSRHYNDMTKLHSEQRLKRFWLTPAEILAHTESTWGDKSRLRRLFGGSPAQKPQPRRGHPAALPARPKA